MRERRKTGFKELLVTITKKVVFLILLLPGLIGQSSAELPVVAEPPENPITEEKRVLGKMLFWDEQLSSNNTMACGTCHIPSSGGADPRTGIHPGQDKLFETLDDNVNGSLGMVLLSSPTTPIVDDVFGLERQVTRRVAPTMIAAMYAPDTLWDGRAAGQFIDPQDIATILIVTGGALESQAILPILDDSEMAHMGRTWGEVISKLQLVDPLAMGSKVPVDLQAVLATNPTYPSLFNDAFGDSAITAARIGMAIATYERTLVPDGSPWDEFRAGNNTAMTPQETSGWNILNDPAVRCLTCHAPPVFSDHLFHNLGLRPTNNEDAGRLLATANENDRGRFKTPTLRNVGLRKHLMHNGRINDARDAIEFYNAESNDDVNSTHAQFVSANQAIVEPGALPYSEVHMMPDDETAQADVAVFLSNALTDPRVRDELFPFDRPTLNSEFSGAVAGSTQLKVMSYNIDATGWTADRADRVKEVIDIEAPDVIGFQEVGVTQLANLQARVGNDFDFFTASGTTNNENVILTRKGRFNVLASGSTVEDAMLFCAGKAYVNYLVLEDINTGAHFSFHNAHFCSLSTVAGDLEVGVTAEQTNQSHAADAISQVGQNLSVYTSASIVVGAFEAAAGSATMDYLLEQVDLPGPVSNSVILDDAIATSSGVANPGTDGILFTPGGVSVVSAQTVSNPTTVAASSHSPVIAVVEIAGGGSGQITGYWRFEEGPADFTPPASNLTTADSSGFGAHANNAATNPFIGTNAPNMPTYRADVGVNPLPISLLPNNFSLEFDGANDYLDIAFINQHNFTSSQDFSISAWVKPTSQGKMGTILSNRDNADRSNLGYSLESYETSGTAGCAISAPSAPQRLIGTIPINDGNWHELRCMVDRGGYMKLCVDGVLDRTALAIVGNIGSPDDLNIGWDGDGDRFRNRFDGLIDEVRIDAVAFSQACSLSGASTDSDGDTIPDGIDNCPSIANPMQLEADNDGTGNVCDTDDDDDGITDAQEDIDGTNPLLVDTDGDGTSDSQEKTDGTDPLDPLSFPVTFYNGKYYAYVPAFVPGKIEWLSAESSARGLTHQGIQGHLVVINDQAENDFIRNTLLTSTQTPWIGASDCQAEGIFTWVTFEGLTYENWAPGQPDNTGSNGTLTDNYVVMHADGQWSDRPYIDPDTVTGYVVEFGGPSGLGTSCSEGSFDSFAVSGNGQIGSSYELVVDLFGLPIFRLSVFNNQNNTPEQFVAEWKSSWDAFFANPSDKDRFVDHLDGSFTLGGSGLTIQVGGVGSTTSVLNIPAGVPFNPTLLHTSQEQQDPPDPPDPPDLPVLSSPLMSNWALYYLLFLFAIYGAARLRQVKR